MIAPIREELLRLLEIIEVLQQTVENSTLTPDEVMEDDLVGQEVTSASLSVIFEELDAIAEIDAKPVSCVFCNRSGGQNLII